MRLADRIAQCRRPFIVQDLSGGALTRLNGPSDYSARLAHCQTRYVLDDELTRLCTALAYSKGARALTCADLLRVPGECLWVEWCEAPWRAELDRYGFPSPVGPAIISGRRGAWVQATRDGRRGSIRTFWSMGDAEEDLLASSLEAHFDFEAADESAAEESDPFAALIRVSDSNSDQDLLARCFRFQYEKTWRDYYGRAGLSAAQRHAVLKHSLGTVAIDIPVLLAFFLLLAMRPGLPRRPLMLERLNQIRVRAGKAPLLDQIEVQAPLLPQYRPAACHSTQLGRRAPRRHWVRGHLVRRGSQLFWRVPHLRGSARAGVIRRRTVTWSIDNANP